LFRAELRPHLAWAWCCSQKRPIFFSAFKTDQVP